MLAMRISARGEYGLRAMVFLACQESQVPVSLEQIGRQGQVPRPFLAQIMLNLRRADLVDSVRGNRGGYLLKRSPSHIAVREVVEALEEDLSLVHCVLDGACVHVDSCLTRAFWHKVQRTLIEMMENTTLADLVPTHIPYRPGFEQGEKG
jgi:Rrf2 family cysteine metabolism transcriptional repressor